MNDSHPTSTNTGHDTSRGSLPTFSVVEVAAILGISKDAVRARLHRGTLEGEKVEGTWRVRLPDDVSLAESASEDRQPPTPDTTASQQGTTPNATPPPSDAMIAHLAHLEGEVAYLREQLAGALGQLADERRRADVLRLSASASEPAKDNDHNIEDAGKDHTAGFLAMLRRWIRGTG